MSIFKEADDVEVQERSKQWNKTIRKDMVKFVRDLDDKVSDLNKRVEELEHALKKRARKSA